MQHSILVSDKSASYQQRLNHRVGILFGAGGTSFQPHARIELLRGFRVKGLDFRVKGLGVFLCTVWHSSGQLLQCPYMHSQSGRFLQRPYPSQAPTSHQCLCRNLFSSVVHDGVSNE